MTATTQWIPIRSAFDIACSSLRRLVIWLAAFSFANRCLGHAWLLLGQHQEALSCYRRVTELRPNFWGGHCRQGQVLCLMGQWEQAEQSCRRSLQLRFYGQTYSSLGEVLYQQGNCAEAVSMLFEAIALRPKDAWAHYYLGLTLSKLGRWGEASDALETAYQLQPEFVWAHYDYGKVQLQLGQWQSAALAYERAAQLAPEERFHHQLGNVLAEAAQWAEAVIAYRRAIELEPGQPGVHQKLADCLRQRNQTGDAAEALALYYQEIEKHPEYLGNYHKALEINPTDVDLYVKLADALAADARWDGAMCFYAIAVQLRPQAAEIHTKLGQTLTHRCNFERAVQHLQQAIDLAPTAQRWLLLAQALAGCERWQAAIQAGEKALSLDPASLALRLEFSLLLIDSGEVGQSAACLQQTLDLLPTSAV